MIKSITMYISSFSTKIVAKVVVSLVTIFGSFVLSSCNKDDGMGTPDANKTPESVMKPIAFKVNLKSYWNNKAESRGVPYNTLDESFGVFASYHEDYERDTIRMNYMYDTESGEVMDAWQTYTPFSMPPPMKGMRFFAYYPYQDEDAEIKYIRINDGNKNHQGAPFFDFSIPDSVLAQPDLMVADCEMTSDRLIAGDTIKFTFHHLLTAVRFTVDSSVPKGRIRNVTIGNVVSGGTYYYGDTPVFMAYDTLKTYSMDTDIRISATSVGTFSEDQAFLMMPQSLGSNAYISITFDNGRIYTFKKTMADVLWEPGKIVTYNIKITSLKDLTLTATIKDWEVGDTFNWTSSF